MEQCSEAAVRPFFRRHLWQFLCGGILFLVLGFFSLCLAAGARDTFYPNYHINGLPVGGLTVPQAQTLLETSLPAQQITITDDSQEVQATLSLAELGCDSAAFAGIAAQQMAVQRDAPFLRKGAVFFAALAGRPSGGDRWPEPTSAALESAAEQLSSFFARAPVHGSYALQSSSIAITKARDGRQLDRDATTALLRDLARCSRAGFLVQAVCKPLLAKPLSAQEILSAVSGGMKNAGYDATAGVITPEKAGASFDAIAAQQALDAAAPGETIEFPAIVTFPSVTAAELKLVLFRDVLGECETAVSGTAARRANVRLASAALNGVVLNAGERFSFNETVGQRTAARGYQAAPAYVRGETVDEIGGGVCQPSSTLYLACLRANLEITQRYAHRYTPSYIPWGMDATVSWGGPDYQFTNNTAYPVKIVTEYEDNQLIIRLLGTNVTGITARITNQQISQTPWKTVYVDDPSLAPGTEAEKTSPYTGCLVKTYRHLYASDGRLLSSTPEATSNYQARDRVILRGPALQLPPEEPEVPALAPEELPVDSSASPPDVPDIPEEPAEPVISDAVIPLPESSPYR